jgi:hypothetical protein
MNNIHSANGAYSADVRMHLAVNGSTYRIGQLGPDFLILDQPSEHPPSEAQIRLSIDGRVRYWTVNLPDGISASRRRTRIVDPPEEQP